MDTTLETGALASGTHRATRVLVIEDDPAMRELLTEELERDGYEVMSVPNVAGARLELLIASHVGLDRMPAVVVTDRRMPDGDGMDLLAEVRRHWWWLPAVVVTAFADNESRRRARALGRCHVLAKPVDLDLVRLAVRESLEP